MENKNKLRMNKNLKDYITETVHKDGTYVCLNLNSESTSKIKKLMEDLKVPNPINVNDLHCTLVYSTQPCPDVEDLKFDLPFDAKINSFTVFPSSQNPGSRVLVLELDCPPAHELYNQATDCGCTSNFPEYRPHITLSYDMGDFSLPLETPDLSITFDSYKIRGLDD